MSLFQEYPHLFVNGRFRCLSKINYYPCRIEGFDAYREEFIIERIGIEMEKCTLVARPIADMTDEECVGFFGWDQGNTDKDRELIKNFASDDGNLDTSGLLYLLSIGVYPFDQSHFEDGTVIDSTEVAEEPE